MKNRRTPSKKGRYPNYSDDKFTRRDKQIANRSSRRIYKTQDQQAEA